MTEKNIYEGSLPEKHFAKYLGMEKDVKEDGTPILKMKIIPEHLNPKGIIHGGVLFSLADSVIGILIDREKRNVVTLDANINFVKKTSSEMIYAVGTEIKAGATILVYDIKVYDDNDVCISAGTFTFYDMNGSKNRK